jgi:hypothetical protein
MRRIAVMTVSAALVGFATFGSVSPAGAATATGCHGSATSFAYGQVRPARYSAGFRSTRSVRMPSVKSHDASPMMA